MTSHCIYRCSLASVALISLFGTILELYSYHLYEKSVIPFKQPPHDATEDLLADRPNTRHTHTALVFPLWMRFFMAFSVIHNGQKILGTMSAAVPSLPTAAFQANTVVTIYGVRFLSMVWIILGHTHAHVSGTLLSINDRPISSSTPVTKPMWLQFVLNSSLAVDTFQLMSGKLVTYGFLSDWHERGRRMPSCSSWVMYYIHRYLR